MQTHRSKGVKHQGATPVPDPERPPNDLTRILYERRPRPCASSKAVGDALDLPLLKSGEVADVRGANAWLGSPSFAADVLIAHGDLVPSLPKRVHKERPVVILLLECSELPTSAAAVQPMPFSFILDGRGGYGFICRDRSEGSAGGPHPATPSEESRRQLAIAW